MSDSHEMLKRFLVAGGFASPARTIVTTFEETRRPLSERQNYAVAAGLQKAAPPSPMPAADAVPDVDALIAESRKYLGDDFEKVVKPADLAAIKADPEVAKRFAKTLSSFRDEHKRKNAETEAQAKEALTAAAAAERARLANLGQALARAERDQ